MHQDKWLCCEKYQEKRYYLLLSFFFFTFNFDIWLFSLFILVTLYFKSHYHFPTTPPPHPNSPKTKIELSSNSHAHPSYFIFSSAISRQTGVSGRSLGGTNLKTREKAFFLQYLEWQRNLFPVSLRGLASEDPSKEKKGKKEKEQK